MVQPELLTLTLKFPLSGRMWHCSLKVLQLWVAPATFTLFIITFIRCHPHQNHSHLILIPFILPGCIPSHRDYCNLISSKVHPKQFSDKSEGRLCQRLSAAIRPPGPRANQATPPPLRCCKSQHRRSKNEISRGQNWMSRPIRLMADGIRARLLARKEGSARMPARWTDGC